MAHARRWEHFHHEADIGVRGTGESLADAFAGAALAMTAVITDPERVGDRAGVPIRCEADDPEMLLYDWLNALVYEMSRQRMLFSRFELSIEKGRLEGSAFGEPIDVERHQPAVEVKGATLTRLSVREEPPGWVAECVVDV